MIHIFICHLMQWKWMPFLQNKRSQNHIKNEDIWPKTHHYKKKVVYTFHSFNFYINKYLILYTYYLSIIHEFRKFLIIYFLLFKEFYFSNWLFGNWFHLFV
jgi:hypothetical protein